MFLQLVWNWDSAWDVFKSVQASYLLTGDIKNLLNLAVSCPNVCLVQQTFVMCYSSLYKSFFLHGIPWENRREPKYPVKEQADVGDNLSPVSNNLSPHDSWLSFHLLNPVTLKSSSSNVPAGSGCSAFPWSLQGLCCQKDGHLTDLVFWKHAIIGSLCRCYLSTIAAASLLLDGFLINRGALTDNLR